MTASNASNVDIEKYAIERAGKNGKEKGTNNNVKDCKSTHRTTSTWSRAHWSFPVLP